MLSYLILSEAYYGNVDTTAMHRLSTRLHRTYNMLNSKNMILDFAAFRYNNITILTTHEYCLLLEFIAICTHYNTIPILNLSACKLETLLLLWLHGFSIGIHFKESDMPLLYNNICDGLTQSLYIIHTLFYNNNPTLQKKLEILNNTLSHTYLANIVRRLYTDKAYLAQFVLPLRNAIHICKHTTCYIHKYIAEISIHNIQQHYPIFVSTHNLYDLEQMLFCGVDYATISPIFYDKGNKALGLDYLQALPNNLKYATFALGGINNDERVKQILHCGVCGFASISYFLC